MKPVTELLNDELDAGYKKTAVPVLKQIQTLSTAPSGEMQTALRELDAHADALDANDKKMSRNDAVLHMALLAYLGLLGATKSLILANDNSIQATGIQLAPISVTSRVFFGISSAMIGANINPIKSGRAFRELIKQSGAAWNIPPDPTKLSQFAAANFIESAAYKARMAKWGEGYFELTRAAALQGIAQGQNPRAIARLIRQHAQSIPLHATDNLMRTLQLTAYREANLAMEEYNGQFIEKKIRIARLDQRTCLSCISLHGTDLAPGERVDDHYRGRCTEFYVVPGGPRVPDFMQADSTPGKRKFVPFKSGEEWFASLSPARQRAQASFAGGNSAKWRAFSSGQITLREFVVEHDDDIFGRQITEGSLISVLGNDAEQFYRSVK